MGVGNLAGHSTPICRRKREAMKRTRTDPVRDKLLVPTPAPGADWSFTNDHGEILLVRTVTYTLVTSAAVATRIPGLISGYDVITWWGSAPAATQVGSLTRRYSAWPGASPGADSPVAITMPLPDVGLVLQQGYTLSSSTAAIQAADQYQAIVLDVIRYVPVLPEHHEPFPETGKITFTEG